MQFRLRYIAALDVLTIPTAMTVSAALLGESILLFFFIGLAFGLTGAVTLFVLAKRGSTNIDW